MRARPHGLRATRNAPSIPDAAGRLEDADRHRPGRPRGLLPGDGRPHRRRRHATGGDDGLVRDARRAPGPVAPAIPPVPRPAVASCSSRYHPLDDRPRAPDRRRRPRVSLRRVRGRSRRAWHGAGPPPSLLRGAAPRAACRPRTRRRTASPRRSRCARRSRTGPAARPRPRAPRSRPTTRPTAAAYEEPREPADAAARASGRSARPAPTPLPPLAPAAQPAARLGGARRRGPATTARTARPSRRRSSRPRLRAHAAPLEPASVDRRGRGPRAPPPTVPPGSRLRDRLARARGERRRPARRVVRQRPGLRRRRSAYAPSSAAYAPSPARTTAPRPSRRPVRRARAGLVRRVAQGRGQASPSAAASAVVFLVRASPVAARPSPSARTPTELFGPAWERPRRYEAYPSLRTRVGLPALGGPPRIVVAGIASCSRRSCLFFVGPMLLGVGSDGPARRPGGVRDGRPGGRHRDARSRRRRPRRRRRSTSSAKGDTMSKIARKNHVTVEQLLAANPKIKNPDLIKVGDKITIPVPEADGGLGRALTAGGSVRAPRPRHEGADDRDRAARQRENGVRLIEVILPASTRNWASRCWLGAPGRRTTRSAW